MSRTTPAHTHTRWLVRPYDNASDRNQIRIFVGGLDYMTIESELKEFIEDETRGLVIEIRIITDRDTNRSRGFAFVTLVPASGEKLDDVIQALNGKKLEGRRLNVDEAKPKKKLRKD